MLEPNLNHPVAFLAYSEYSGSHFLWWYLKMPILGLLARNRSNQCTPLHDMSKDASFRVSVFSVRIMVWSMKPRPLSAGLQGQNPTNP